MTKRRVNYAKEFSITVDKYMKAAESQNFLVEAAEANKLSSLMGTRNSTDAVRAADLERIILFLMIAHGATLRAGLMMQLLNHVNTPVSVLTTVCRGPNEAYRAYAAQNPNCREEDRVYVALADTHKDMPWL